MRTADEGLGLLVEVGREAHHSGLNRCLWPEQDESYKGNKGHLELLNLFIPLLGFLLCLGAYFLGG